MQKYWKTTVTILSVGLILLAIIFELLLVIREEPPIHDIRDPVVTISNGKIRGVSLRNVFNRTYYAFLDVPYAAPPVGELRFQTAKPAKNWDGILNTTQNRKICWEISRLKGMKIVKPEEDEDCLYLNVYTPQLANLERLLPVIVYIYGGYFETGFAWQENYDFQLLVDQEIIVVTFNYRSGPLGFISTEDDTFPKNVGLKDQRFALEWVQKNIKNFGGDPSKVTLMGHSSGAMSVSYHQLNKKSRGLFRSVMMISGSVISPTSFKTNLRNKAYELGKQLSPKFSDRNSSTDLLNLLKNCSAHDIYQAELPFPTGTTIWEIKLGGHWGPVMEDPFDEDAIITGSMYEDLFNGNFLKVPTIIGIASEEFLSFAYFLKLPEWYHYLDNPEELIKFKSDVLPEKRAELGQHLKDIYTNTTSQDNFVRAIRYLSDYLFGVPAVIQAVLMSKYTDVYFHQFSYFSKTILFEGFEHPVNIPGLSNTGHAEDRNLYILRGANKLEKFWAFSVRDFVLYARIVRLWTNFVNHMNPTPKRDPLLQNVSWSTVNSEEKYEFTFLDIDNNLTMVHNYPTEYLKWKPLIKKYYQHPIHVI